MDGSNINVELAPQDIYSGMYARVTLNFFAFNSNGNKGIGCGLGNVLKTRDGEPLAGGATAAQDFEGISIPAPAPVPGAMAPQMNSAVYAPGVAPAPAVQPAYAVPQGQATQYGVPAVDPITGQPLPFI